MRKTTVIQTEEDLRREAGEDRDYLKGKDLSKIDEIGRSKTPLINDEVDNFKFMQMDIDYYTMNSDRLPGKY